MLTNHTHLDATLGPPTPADVDQPGTPVPVRPSVPSSLESSGSFRSLTVAARSHPRSLAWSRRHGFTLIELLIVIAVLGILITLGTLGFRRITNQNKEKATYTTLANCVSMFKELSSQAGVNTFGTGTLASPGVVTSVNPAGRDAAANDARQRFFNVAWQVPALRKSLENFPQDQRLPSPTPGGAFVPTDAWNNPIIFVPAGGLTGVTIRGSTGTVTAPDGRPFFASAGADGDFTTGDDNVYSFEAP